MVWTPHLQENHLNNQMDSPDIIPNSQPDSSDPLTAHVTDLTPAPAVDYVQLEDEVIANFQKDNLPNVNVPEKIIICLDVCSDDPTILYRLGDGTSYTSLNMLKRVLDFFIHTKHAINKRTQFALLILKDSIACWFQDFTNNIKEVFSSIDLIGPEESISDTFDFNKVFDLLQEKVEIPEYKQGQCILPPPYIVRMIVLYSRSNCMPQIPMEDNYFVFLKKQPYCYIDILLSHEDECALNKCEEIYDSLQDLDNGYSYVFEVGRNATKIHDSIAKLLAHPLQRPLQKNTDYSFGSNKSSC